MHKLITVKCKCKKELYKESGSCNKFHTCHEWWDMAEIREIRKARKSFIGDRAPT
jgi:hypothetical protein